MFLFSGGRKKARSGSASPEPHRHQTDKEPLLQGSGYDRGRRPLRPAPPPPDVAPLVVGRRKRTSRNGDGRHAPRPPPRHLSADPSAGTETSTGTVQTPQAQRRPLRPPPPPPPRAGITTNGRARGGPAVLGHQQGPRDREGRTTGEEAPLSTIARPRSASPHLETHSSGGRGHDLVSVRSRSVSPPAHAAAVRVIDPIPGTHHVAPSPEPDQVPATEAEVLYEIGAIVHELQEQVRMRKSRSKHRWGVFKFLPAALACAVGGFFCGPFAPIVWGLGIGLGLPGLERARGWIKQSRRIAASRKRVKALEARLEAQGVPTGWRKKLKITRKKPVEHRDLPAISDAQRAALTEALVKLKAARKQADASGKALRWWVIITGPCAGLPLALSAGLGTALGLGAWLTTAVAGAFTVQRAVTGRIGCSTVLEPFRWLYRQRQVRKCRAKVREARAPFEAELAKLILSEIGPNWPAGGAQPPQQDETEDAPLLQAS